MPQSEQERMDIVQELAACALLHVKMLEMDVDVPVEAPAAQQLARLVVGFSRMMMEHIRPQHPEGLSEMRNWPQEWRPCIRAWNDIPFELKKALCAREEDESAR